MPLYEYVCKECDSHVEVLRSIAQADEPVLCLSCGQPAMRAVSLIAAWGWGSEAGHAHGASPLPMAEGFDCCDMGACSCE